MLAAYLRARGYSVLEQPLADGRVNVIAAVGEPRLVFSTHFDCVPPFFPSRVEGDLLYGRGACDARAFWRRRWPQPSGCARQARSRVGLVFVAGEERGSDGAMAANQIASPSKFLINGEPTDNRLGAATRGVYRVRLDRGRARRAFRLSGTRRVGDRQADRRAGGDCARRAWPADDVLGMTHYTVGSDQRRRRAQRHPAARGSGDRVSQRRRSRRAARRCSADGRRPRDVEEVLEVPPVRLQTVAWLRNRRLLLTPPTSRSSVAGGRRSCWARARSTSRTPIASTSSIARTRRGRGALRTRCAAATRRAQRAAIVRRRCWPAASARDVEQRHDGLQRIDDSAVELASAMRARSPQCATRTGQRFSIGAIVGEGIEGIGDGDDAAGERNGFAGQPVRIAAAVPSLVMR